MQNPEKYEILEVIYESSRSKIVSAIEKNNQKNVILKILNKEYPSPEEINKFKKEYELLQKLTNEGIIESYELFEIDKKPAIAIESFGGEPFSKILKSKKLTMEEFLNISIRIAEILKTIHDNNIIHKDINLSNIIWNIEKDIIKIIDFGISTKLPREITSLKNPNILEGTLAYISPEQTGRMNRSLDYRTDYYSLGVSFYFMLTEKLPFETEDVLQMIHSHIALSPEPPIKIDNTIPETISNIVMKLISKDQEDRYESSHGLIEDLKQCQKEFKETGKIKPFELGLHDMTDKFQIPQKLYGREKEIKSLMDAFEKARKNDPELMLVSGFSGIGKSVLINEVQRPVVKYKGNYISGKFERLKKNVPYSAIIQAFTGFAKQILAEDENEITRWKDIILSYLGPNGKIITDIIPIFELIIGEQPEILDLGPVETQNRFNMVLQEFIKSLTGEDRPLVLFLDDLQWADSGSLHLLKLFTTDPDIKYLYLIGAYRHNETPESHPLMITIGEIKRTGKNINSIQVGPLKKKHVTSLLEDTLKSSTKKNIPLAELLIKKTHGNPFFINEFLKSLYKENLIHFSPKKGWQWDMKTIDERQATDNVIELMTEKISHLSPQSQEVLKLCSCIGSYFDLETFLKVSEKNEKEILPALNEIIQEGMINKIDNIYRFSHDRIMEASYSLITEKEKVNIHYNIGTFTLKNTKSAGMLSKIFYITNQLNAGISLVKEKPEKQKLSELNLMAGEKALLSNAYDSALNYLKTGLQLLEKNHWKKNYEFTLKLYTQTTAAAQLNADYNLMEKLFRKVIKNAVNILDTIKVYETKIFSNVAQRNPHAALKTGLVILKQLGTKIPKKPGKLRILKEIILIKFAMIGRSIEDLVNSPKMKNPNKIAAMQILHDIASSAYDTSPDVFALVTLICNKYSIKYGYTIYCPYSYAGLGMIYCGILGDIEDGYKFGKLALDLVNKYNVKEIKPRVWVIFWWFINHWKKPLHSSIDPMLDSYKTALEIGDMEFAAHSANIYTSNLFLAFKYLLTVEKDMIKYI